MQWGNKNENKGVCYSLLMRLVCTESSRVKMCELDSVSESKRVQRLHRPSFLCNSRLVFLVFRAYPTMRVRLCLLNMSSVFEWYVCK